MSDLNDELGNFDDEDFVLSSEVEFQSPTRTPTSSNRTQVRRKRILKTARLVINHPL